MAVRELEPAFPGAPEPSPPPLAPRRAGRRGRDRRGLDRRGLGWRAWRGLDRPIVSGLLALLGMLGFVLARWQRWSRGDIGSWILVGSRFASAGRVWLAPGVLIRQNSAGYDGQFYYRLAINPANLHESAYGITLDAPYRLMRIGYPVLTWLASAGHRALVPVMLVAVNVAAMAAIGLLGGVFARQGGHHALWGMLLPAYCGLITSVARDTAEPVACAFLLGGLLAIRARRSVLAGVLLACGALTRETVMVAVGAVAAVRVVALARRPRRFRPGREDVAWLLPAAAFAAWELVVRTATGSFPLLADDDQNAGLPFIAVYHAIQNNLRDISWSHFTDVDIWVLELAVLTVVAVMALACWRRSWVPLHERVALVAFLVEICVVTPSTWNSLNADLRSFVEVYLLAVVVLLGVPRPRPQARPQARFSRLPAWLLPMAAAWALPVLIVVAGRRIIWS
jgi:hypothetical protein